jgi:hypothetical protein
MKRAVAIALLSLALPVAAQQPHRGQVIMRADPPQTAPTPPPAQYPLAVQDRFARARDNLVALRDGRVAVSDLTDIELQDVLDLDRALRERTLDTRTPQQQCIDEEVRRAGGQPSELEWKVIDLKCRP